jgi:hypothetical protein
VEFTKEEQWFRGGRRAPPFFFFFLSFFFFFQNGVIFWGYFLNCFLFSKGHFSNLTPKNDVVLYFSSNLTVFTNEGAKIQLSDSLGCHFITFESLGG